MPTSSSTSDSLTTQDFESLARQMVEQGRVHTADEARKLIKSVLDEAGGAAIADEARGLVSEMLTHLSADRRLRERLSGLFNRQGHIRRLRADLAAAQARLAASKGKLAAAALEKESARRFALGAMFDASPAYNIRALAEHVAAHDKIAALERFLSETVIPAQTQAVADLVAELNRAVDKVGPAASRL